MILAVLASVPLQGASAVLEKPVSGVHPWGMATPESQGMDSVKLEALWKSIPNSTALLVIRNDQILFERYAAGYSRTKPHYTASMAKALVGGVSLMVALSDGLIQPDDLACRYVPQWSNDPLKRIITIRHLATHTSGLEDAEADDMPHDKLSGWKGDFWKRLAPPRDPFTLARDAAPVMEPPGTRARYSNPGMAMLSYCVTASLRGAPDSDVRSLLKHRIMDPIGVPPAEWSIGYGTSTRVEGLALVANWGGGGYSPNAAACVGRLMLRRGDWDGNQLISPEVVAAGLRHAGLPNFSGLAWWVNRRADGSRPWRAAPADAFAGAGAGHQVLFVAPSLQLIVVRNGERLGVKEDFDTALDRFLITPLMQAFLFQASSALPPSPVIKKTEWAAPETILRQAQGSDNWPMTWADDDALYTAYGDGNGFKPFLPVKLSLGLAKVLGAPPEFSGTNLRSETGEQLGDGVRGRKASGLLMVDGMLYLWARNAGNSQLAWSGDHGKSWQWSEWKFTNSFGYPTFLNFGRNYAGARDEYVYVFSPDTDSAYQTSDGLVLARVNKDQIRNRQAYEFYGSLDTAGNPVWTQSPDQRESVLHHPGRCYRSSVSYNAALQRYLLVHTVPGPASRNPQGQLDTRFTGGLAIYDAPEPWGPWTTVYFTDQWDVGPGDTASFPTKWMSSDGKTLYLVFSGDDSFSVRKAVLSTTQD